MKEFNPMIAGQPNWHEKYNDDFSDLYTRMEDKVDRDELEDLGGGQGGGLYTATAGYENGVFTLSGLPEALGSIFTVSFVAPAAYTEGDRFQMGERVVSLFGLDLEAVGSGAFAAGALVSLNVDYAAGRAFILSGGGGGSYGILPAQTKITVLAADASASVTLENPGGEAYAGTLLVVKKGGTIPADEKDGAVYDAGKATTYTISNLVNGAAYVVRAFAYNPKREIQTDTTDAIYAFTPSGLATDPPGNVLNLKATPGNKCAVLTWRDPADAAYTKWAGTMVRRKTGGYPTDESDGELVVDSKTRDHYQTTGYMDQGLENGETYYYQAFPYSESGEYNRGVDNRVKVVPAPTEFEYLASFTSNYTWAAPETGWYKVFVWGRSGDGGKGGKNVNANITGNGGAGGSSGGFAASLLHFEQGVEIPVTITDERTTFGKDNTSYYMYANRGSNGADGQEATGAIATGGSGGSAAGGNIANIMGFTGGSGGRGYSTTYGAPLTAYPGDNNGASAGGIQHADLGGAPGGGGARVPGNEYCKYVNDKMATEFKGGNGGGISSNNLPGLPGSSVPTPIPGSGIVVSGAGSGGGGAGRSNSVLSPASGGLGSGGVVIIEKSTN